MFLHSRIYPYPSQPQLPDSVPLSYIPKADETW